jgi:uncharacterized protein (DUF58 family)
VPDLLENINEGARLLRTLPWVLLLAVFLPLAMLASWRKTYPHVPLVLLLAGPCLLTFMLLVWDDLFLVVLMADAMVALIAIADLLTVPAERTFSVERTAMRVASINMPHRVELVINNHSNRTFFVQARDDTPNEFIVAPEEFSLNVTPRSRAAMHYEFKAQRRGAFTLTKVFLRTRSLLGLWRRYLTYEANTVVHVYPDMKQLSEYAILARTNRLSLMGVRRTRRIGTDNEFERLRDYTLDDNYKHIDWRTTARRSKLTVKDFQTNQSQRIIFLMDCGRMMTNESSGLSLLDHSFNAMLMLSFVALRQGDSVGMVAFSDQIHNFVPPRGGMAQMNRLLHAGFDRFPRLVESRYDEAFVYLDSHCKKRSLVVLITNLIDEVNSHQIHRYLTNLVGRHLPLGVLLRDHHLFDAVDGINPQLPIPDQKLFRGAAAAEILTWRHQVLTDMEHRGVLSLDVFPEEMTAPLVNQYLNIKARHLL